MALICAFLDCAAVHADDALPKLGFVGSSRLHDRDIGLTEPSGLSVRGDGKLFVVSDDTSAVFVLDIKGLVLDRLDVFPPVRDLEGIAFDPERGRMLLLSEEDRTIFDVDSATGQARAAFPIRGMTGGGDLRFGKDGPEGLSIGPDGEVLLLIEYPPRLLRISGDLTTVLEVRSLEPEAGYLSNRTNKIDASGVAYDRNRDAVWILSDTGKAVFYRPFDSEILVRFDLSFIDGDRDLSGVDNPEGIAVSDNGTMLFVVTDDGKSSRLLQYAID